jgi:predicted ATP-dependent protease
MTQVKSSGLKSYEVPADKLRWTCDPEMFKFKCTKELAPLKDFIGQERATRAVEFGLNMGNSGYNIYVSGITGTGRTSMVKTYIERLIKEKEQTNEKAIVQDWCYFYNFTEPDCPQIASLPQGQGKVFRDDINELLNTLKSELGRAFSSEEYREQKKKMVEEARSQQEAIFEEVASEVRKQGFVLQMSPVGPVIIPVIDGKPMEERDYLTMDDAARKQIETKQNELLKQVQSNFEKAGEIQKQTVEKLVKADKDIGEYTVARSFGKLFEKYSPVEKVTIFLTALKKYTLDNLDSFKASEEPVNPIFGVPISEVMGGRHPFVPFQINVYVDNSELKGPPVIIETNPNFGNIFGKIERRFLFGGYLSDHTMLKSGALSRANGGYLLLNALDVLTNPGVWPALKRAIRDKQVKIEDPFEQFGLIAPQGLRPEPMPIKTKIVLAGDNMVYQALAMYDEDFWEIFKVKADFNIEIEKNNKNMMDYAAFIKGCCEECETRHLDPTGVAKIIEYSARMVGDQERLSSRFAQIKDWIEESEYWAAKESSKYITAVHVKKAIEEKLFRHNLVDEKMRDMISRGIIMIDVGGETVGQVNGLSVYSLGDITFGKPSRITAQTFLGRSGVINIERESEMSGPIHNKGVMILAGYMGWKYAQEKPLSLSASLCFEQSYEGVEGDSASSTELYAILSSLSGIPVKQNIAVTGSVNQKGEIQPIGGVNHKIEGFYEVCKAKELTGDQGVLIPHQNVINLMLKEEVVDAVKQGKFHIYSAKTVDDGIEILTGTKAGERQPDGSYPRGSINYLVSLKLGDMADKLKAFSGPNGKVKDTEELHKMARKAKSTGK